MTAIYKICIAVLLATIITPLCAQKLIISTRKDFTRDTSFADRQIYDVITDTPLVSGPAVAFARPTDVVCASISFFKSRFTGKSLFANIDFQNKLSFNSAVFTNGLNCQDVTFSPGSNFASITSSRQTYIARSSIDSADFTYSTLENFSIFQTGLSSTNFSYAKFTGSNDYIGSKSSIRKCSFNGSVFKKNIIFYWTTLDSVDFKGAFFYGNTIITDNGLRELDFSDAKFMKNLVIEPYMGSSYRGTFDFSNAEFSDSSELILRGMPDTLDFSGTKFGRPVNLSIYQFDRHNEKDKVYIRLLDTDISKVNFDYINFRLVLRNEKGDYPFELGCTIYEALLRKYKDRGSIESYKNLDREYQVYKDESIGKWRSKLNRLWWNFGYNREYCFYYAIGFILLFSLINYRYIDYLNQKVYPIPSIPKLQKQYSSKLYKLRVVARYKRRYGSSLRSKSVKYTIRRFYYSLMYSSSIFFRLTLKLENINFKYKAGSIYLFIIYTLGIICLAYMANFVLQK